MVIDINKRNLVGMTFGKLTVLRDSGKRHNCGNVLWECQCNCENKTIKLIPTNYLTSGKTKSCGCAKKDAGKKRKKKNEYDLTSYFGIGYTNKGEEFYFDLEDYDKIKDYYWVKSGDYIISNNRKKYLHRLIMDINVPEIHVDHISHVTIDNRKDNLRLATNQQNSFNKSVKGVWFDKSRNKWCAELHISKQKYFKRFETFDEALAQRKVWEEEFFGKFAYQEPPESYIAELNELSKVN